MDEGFGEGVVLNKDQASEFFAENKFAMICVQSSDAEAVKQLLADNPELQEEITAQIKEYRTQNEE